MEGIRICSIIDGCGCSGGGVNFGGSNGGKVGVVGRVIGFCIEIEIVCEVVDDGVEDCDRVLPISVDFSEGDSIVFGEFSMTADGVMMVSFVGAERLVLLD